MSRTRSLAGSVVIEDSARRTRQAGGAHAASEAFPAVLELLFEKRAPLRYGENPHQPAAFYVEPGCRHACVAAAETLHGKELSYNNLLDLDIHLKTLNAWKEAGKVRYVGVTHYTVTAHEELVRVLGRHRLDFVQLNYALDDRQAEQRLLPLAAERGIAILVNQPFGGGGLIRKLGSRPLPAWAGEIGCTSWAQILLKFVLANPAVTCVIPGTSKPEHMRDNIQAGTGAYPDAGLLKKMISDVDA